MVFSSLPLNQFDSLNWQQQANHHELESTTTDQNPNNFQPPASSLAVTGGFSHGTSQTNRVNSMVERARIAKIPLPESALKCPRCNSTNTKFCYFNNYSLTQPRHFCKTCRRYWTRGGALRNVPVGGGCRRNKRSKSNGAKSKSTLTVSQGENQISQLSSLPSYSSNPNKFLDYTQIPSFTSNSQILPLGDYNTNNIGLDFGAIQLSNGVNGSSSTSGSILDPWRSVSSLQQIQQNPFLINNSGLDQSSNVLYPLLEGTKPLMDMDSREGGTKSSNVKAEACDQDCGRDQDGVNNVSRNFLGNMNINSSENNEYMTSWGGSNNNISSSWTGFNSNNSTGHVSF